MYSHVPLPLCPAPYWPWTSAVFILSIQHCVQSCTTTTVSSTLLAMDFSCVHTDKQHCVQSCTTTTVSSTLLAMDFSCVHTDNTALCTVMYHYHCVQHPIGHGLQLCSYCQYSTVYSHVPLPLCPAPYWPWTSAVFILTIQHCVQSCTTTTVSSTLCTTHNARLLQCAALAPVYVVGM